MKSDVNNLNMITDEVISTGTYDNMEDYLARGIGYTPIINNKVCGFCTSEYQSRNSVAIGIEVLGQMVSDPVCLIITLLADTEIEWESEIE